MKRVIVTVCAATLMLVTACGNDDAEHQVKTDWSEAEIVEQMDLVASSDGAGWTFDATGDQGCSVVSVLTSPVDVQAAENAGDIVAVNAAGSAGVTIAADEPESCLDAATELLSELE